MATTTLSPEHRHFLIFDQCIGAAVINFVLNAGIAWLLVRSLARVPLWGDPSIAGDTAATSLLLPLITCLIVTPLVRRRIAAGRIAPLPEAPASRVLQVLVRRGAFTRGLLLGVACIALLALPTVLLFVLIGPADLSHGSFIWFKAAYAAILAAIITPVIGLLALATPSKRSTPAAN
jgi:hypothetical protein